MNEKLLFLPQSETKENELVVKDFDTINEELNKNLQEFLNKHLMITSDIELKEVKEYRTMIRATQNKLKEERDFAYAKLVGTFTDQCMTMEKAIASADKQLKALVDDYVDRDKPKLITLEIKSYDMANIQAVVDFATKLGLETKVK